MTTFELLTNLTNGEREQGDKAIYSFNGEIGKTSRSSTTSTSTDADDGSTTTRSSSAEDDNDNQNDNDSAFKEEEHSYGSASSRLTSCSSNFSHSRADVSTLKWRDNVDGLLRNIYGGSSALEEDLENTLDLVRQSSRAGSRRGSMDGQRSPDSECTAWREKAYSHTSQAKQALGFQGTVSVDKEHLQLLGVEGLRKLVASYKKTCKAVNGCLIAEVKKKEQLLLAQSRKCLVISTALQAKDKDQLGRKRLFSITAPPGPGYNDWLEAMRGCLCCFGSLPSGLRKTVWTTIANQYISQLPIEWWKVKLLVFRDHEYPSEETIQIEKDLHRTGIPHYCGDHKDRERQRLKRVLLAYARFRPSVGYCQGFNIIAAVILTVVDSNEEEALKIMILLIEHVLPPNYFDHDLQALSVDVSVFQQLVNEQLPELSTHLDTLRTQSLEERGASVDYEPSLISSFTVQWFLTLFATCLPQETTLQVWDMLLLFDSSILMKTGVVLLRKLEKHILTMDCADEFYSSMAQLQCYLRDSSFIKPSEVVSAVFSLPDFDVDKLRLQQKFQSPRQIRYLKNRKQALRQTKSAEDKPMRHRLFSGLLERRRSSVLLQKEKLARRLSLAESQANINELKKQYIEYAKQPDTAVIVDHVRVIKEQVARKRGSIFTMNDELEDDDDDVIHQEEKFHFPPTATAFVPEEIYNEATKQVYLRKTKSTPSWSLIAEDLEPEHPPTASVMSVVEMAAPPVALGRRPSLRPFYDRTISYVDVDHTF